MFKWLIRATVFVVSIIFSLFLYSFSLQAVVEQSYQIQSEGKYNDTKRLVEVYRSVESEIGTPFNYAVFDIAGDTTNPSDAFQTYRVSTTNNPTNSYCNTSGSSASTLCIDTTGSDNAGTDVTSPY